MKNAFAMILFVMMASSGNAFANCFQDEEDTSTTTTSEEQEQESEKS